MSKPKTTRAATKTRGKAPRVPVSLPADAGADAPKPKRAPWGRSNLPAKSETGAVIPTNKPIQHPRDAILRAFERLGGRRWLVKLGKQYPKEFASLLARMVPTDINVTGTVGYAPLVIPVEARDALPGAQVDPRAGALEGVFEPIEPDPFM